MSNIVQIFTKETCQLLANMDMDERRAKLCGVLSAHFRGDLGMKAPAIAIAEASGLDPALIEKVLLAASQKGIALSDTPNGVNRNPVTAAVFNMAQADPLLDFGYEELFDLVDMRSAGQTNFDILDINNLITFNEVKSGARMKKYGITDGKTSVEKMTVAAAMGILDDWINYYQFWNLNQAATEAESKYRSKMAADHYALIVAAGEVGGQTTAFATDDITTINNACAKILTDLQGMGYVITGNETFELRANINLKQKIEKAFALTFNSPNTDNNQLVHTLNRKYNTTLAATSYYVVLAGRKLKRGVWSDLKAETDRDILMRGSDVAYSGEYNAGVGEVKQVRKCALA